MLLAALVLLLQLSLHLSTCSALKRNKSCTAAPDPALCRATTKALNVEYETNLMQTLNISKRQTDVFVGQWRIDACNRNPALVEWSFGTWRGFKPLDDNSTVPLLVTWCVSGSFSCWFTVVQKSASRGWVVLKQRDLIERVAPQTLERTPLSEPGHGNGWADVRLFRSDETGRVQMIYYDTIAAPGAGAGAGAGADGHGRFFPSTDHLLFNASLDSLYSPRPKSVRLSLGPDHARSEKNWTPFNFNGTTHYVYSISPEHVVLAADQLIAQNVQRVKIAYTSPHPSSSLKNWKWGEMRGGSPAVLIDSPHGPRLLTLFHSQARIHLKTVKTYFFGAYLFLPHPPFNITHITPEPLVPKGDFYNSSAAGWAYGNLDHVVFPMGLVALKASQDAVVASVGLNDARCYLLELRLSALFRLMAPAD